MPVFVPPRLNLHGKRPRPACRIRPVTQLREAIKAVEWDLGIGLLQPGAGAARWGLSTADQQYVLQKAMASSVVRYRNVAVFRRLLEIRFPMDWVDVALEEALKLQDRDMVDEIFEKLFPGNPDPCHGTSVAGRLPRATMKRMLKLLAPVSWTHCYANRLIVVLKTRPRHGQCVANREGLLGDRVKQEEIAVSDRCSRSQ